MGRKSKYDRLSEKAEEIRKLLMDNGMFPTIYDIDSTINSIDVLITGDEAFHNESKRLILENIHGVSCVGIKIMESINYHGWYKAKHRYFVDLDKK